MSDDVEKPRSKSTLLCPKFQKQQRTVCHKCAFWEHIKGTHPQTGEPLDKWGCVIVHQFMLGLENNKVTYEQGAAVESLRNELVEYQRIALRVQYREDPGALKVIEGEFKRLDMKALARIAPPKEIGRDVGTEVEELHGHHRVDFANAGKKPRALPGKKRGTGGRTGSRITREV